MGSVKFYAAVIGFNVRASLARGVLLQMIFMILNNAIFWVTWFIFFNRFEQVNGWRLPEVTLMYATVQLAWGLKIVLFGGTRNLARVITDGEFDGYLLLPRHPLLYIGATQSFASGWGDIASGIVLAAASGLLGLTTAALYVIGVLCAFTTFLAAEVILHSAAFWLGPINTLSRQWTEFLIMLSAYPQNVYRGWMKVAIYLLIPAAVIGQLPVELVQGSWRSGALMVALTAMFAAGAWAVFARGVRRYGGR